MLRKNTRCLDCAHYDRTHKRWGVYCKAFPEGIPMEIFDNKFDHHNPFPGDNGIQFEPKKPESQV